MKHIIPMAALTLALLASPAFALRVTNLDKVARTVELAGGGVLEQRTIEPGDTEYFTGSNQGRLSLITPAAPGKKGRPLHHTQDGDTTVHADGILSGVIGAERSENIPADPDSDYTIWPGGTLAIQSNKRVGNGRF